MKRTFLVICMATILAACATEPYLQTAPEKYNVSVSNDCLIKIENADLMISSRVESSAPSLEQVMRVEACSRSSLRDLPITFHVEEAVCRFGRTVGLSSPAVQTRFELSYSLNGIRSESLSNSGLGDGTGRPLCDVYFWPLVITVMDQVEQSIR